MTPFYFYTRITQVELLGRSAKNIKELLEGIVQAPASSIYHHTHRYLEQHRNFSPVHPNDFSYWISAALGLKALGEKIASVDIVRFPHIDDLRKVFIGLLTDYLWQYPVLRCSLPGEEFRFLSSRIFIFPTPFAANSLEEFALCLEKVTIHSLYFHMFESKMRLTKSDNDFSRWLRGVSFPALAESISRLDPYTYTLEGLRREIIKLVRSQIR